MPLAMEVTEGTSQFRRIDGHNLKIARLRLSCDSYCTTVTTTATTTVTTAVTTTTTNTTATTTTIVTTTTTTVATSGFFIAKTRCGQTNRPTDRPTDRDCYL